MRISDWSSDVCSSDLFGDAGGRLVYTKLYEAFFVQVKIAVFGAFCLSFPIIANQLWAFVAPGLYAKEKKALLPFLIATPFLFAMGASLAYFVVMPTAFHFFLEFQGNSSGLQVEALPSADSYLRSEEHTSELQSLMRISYA